MRADALAVEVLPDHEAALRRHEHAVLDREVREVEREHLPPARSRSSVAAGAPVAGDRLLGLVRQRRRMRVPGLRRLEREPRRREVLGTDAAAAADQLGALLAPLERELGVLGAADARLVPPAGGRQVAEVRVDAEREVGEVPQPREHPGDVVGRHAVDRQRADAHLLEAARRAAERVALGAAPMLAVDAADAVPAAAEAEPHRQPGLEQRLDRRVRRAAHERQRLEQDQVGPVLLERAREQADRLATVGRVDVAVDAERDGHLVAAAGLVGRGAREPHARRVRRPSSAPAARTPTA